MHIYTDHAGALKAEAGTGGSWSSPKQALGRPGLWERRGMKEGMAVPPGKSGCGPRG